jgi:hypothetical protein
MKINEIKETAKTLSRKYLNTKIQKELKGYAVFFTKKDMLQPETSGTVEDLLRLCSLAIDLQAIRERVVLIFLDVKKAKSRLKRLYQELMSNDKFSAEYRKQSNKELREIYVYKNGKTISVALSKARLISEQCELIISNIDSHVWVLKNNSQVLSRAVRSND